MGHLNNTIDNLTAIVNSTIDSAKNTYIGTTQNDWVGSSEWSPVLVVSTSHSKHCIMTKDVCSGKGGIGNIPFGEVNVIEIVNARESILAA
jgi:hypothetical protein